MRFKNTNRRALGLKAAAPSSLTLAVLLAAPFSAAFAQSTPSVSVGAGIRTSFTDFSDDSNSADDFSDFELNSARIYISGTVTDSLKVMFNTEYSTVDEDVNVIDAAAM